MEDSVVEVALILYGIFAIAVLVSITALRVRVKYITISTATLDSLMCRCENLLVIALREANNRIVPGALLVPADQLSGLLRWVPPGSTWSYPTSKRQCPIAAGSKTRLLEVGIEFVYVLNDEQIYTRLTAVG
jgi:hypothetical protein